MNKNPILNQLTNGHPARTLSSALLKSISGLGESNRHSQIQGQLQSAYVRTVLNQEDVSFGSESQYSQFEEPINAALRSSRVNAAHFQDILRPEILNLLTLVDSMMSEVIVLDSMLQRSPKPSLEEVVGMLGRLARNAYNHTISANRTVIELRRFRDQQSQLQMDMDIVLADLELVIGDQGAEIDNLSVKIKELSDNIQIVEQSLLLTTIGVIKGVYKGVRIVLGVVAVYRRIRSRFQAPSGTSVIPTNPDAEDKKLIQQLANYQKEKTEAYEDRQFLMEEAALATGIKEGMRDQTTYASTCADAVSDVATYMRLHQNNLSELLESVSKGDTSIDELSKIIALASGTARQVRDENSRMRDQLSGVQIPPLGGTSHLWSMLSGTSTVSESASDGGEGEEISWELLRVKSQMRANVRYPDHH